MPGPENLEQQRAQFAWEKVNAVTDIAKYRDAARKFPSLLHANGFGQALAFIKEKNKDLYTHLDDWLREEIALYPDAENPEERASQGDLLVRTMRGSRSQLQRALIETEALAVWLKRFSEAKEKARSEPSRATPEEGVQPAEAGPAVMEGSDTDAR